MPLRPRFLRLPKGGPLRRRLLILGAILVTGPAPSARAQFTDVTVAAGLHRLAASRGAAFAHLDDDERLDLYVGFHTAPPLLYWNQGGSFNWLAHPQPWTGPTDRHGPLIVALDDDERPDLFVTHGGAGGTGSEANELYRNDGAAQFAVVPGAMGMDDPLGRTRCASAADFNGDLRLDVWIGKAPRMVSANALFRNDAGLTFTDVAFSEGLAESVGTEGGLWSDFDGDGDPDLLVGGEEFHRPTILWRNDGGTFADVSFLFTPPLPVVSGADWGDLDSDGDPDLVVCDGDIGLFDTWAEGDTVTWYFNTRYGEDGVDGLTIPSGADTATASLRFRAIVDTSLIFLGPSAVSPPPGPSVLLTDDYVGAPAFTPGTDLGIYVWRAAPGGDWELRCSTPNRNFDTFNGWVTDGTVISGTGGTNLEDSGFTPGGPKVWRNDGGAFAEITSALGLPLMLNPRHVTWVDYDNDGDLDLHVVDMGTSAAPNAPDALLRNDGASFADVTAAEGVAAGSLGMGDGAVWGDGDGDGDLDVFVRQGAGPLAFSAFAPSAYLRNDGDRGRSVQLDLTGSAPAFAAVGAEVRVVAGTLAFTRHVSANAWRGFQNPLRVHLGIGAASQADSLTITWPSGSVHAYSNVAPGIYAVREDEIALDALGSTAPVEPGWRLEGPAPQPARGKQFLRLRTSRPSELTVTVHDVAGRRLRSVYRGSVEPGTTLLSWDGRNEDGARVASGVYFVRVTDGRTLLVRRSVRVR